MWGHVAKVITNAKFCDNRFKAFRVIYPQFCHSP